MLSPARFSPLPTHAAWRHQDTRTGFEVAQFELRPSGGFRVFGCTNAVEADQCWTVQYEMDIDADWTTRRAVIVGRSADGPRRTLLEPTASVTGGSTVAGPSTSMAASMSTWSPRP